MGGLIVTADDFGLAQEVNEAVELAHRYGLLSAASLMVAKPAAADAIERARRLPSLHVGLHLVLVDGQPSMPPEKIPGLLDTGGRLRRDLVRLAFELVASEELRSQLRAEIRAQFLAFARTGLTLDHVDVHRHYHLHPVVAREIIAVSRDFGVTALRVPVEPASVIYRVQGRRLTTTSFGLAACAAYVRRLARHAGLLTPDAVFGLAWSGAFTKDRLAGVLRQLPQGLVEIYTHPATADRFPGAAPGYHYSEELEALCAPEVLETAAQLHLTPIGYSAVAQPSLTDRRRLRD